jgi:hypothetical protein
MTTTEYTVSIHGDAVRRGGVEPAAAGEVLVRLERSLHGAVDVAFRRSSGAGRRQPWLREAARVSLKHAEKHGQNEMAMYFEAPCLGDVAEAYFSQPRLFEDGPSADETAFDSDRFDSGLLRRFHRFQPAVLDRQVDEIVIGGGRVKTAQTYRISRQFTDRARELYRRTPEAGRVRIAGKLDMIVASTMAFGLIVEGGQRVRGIWKGEDFETLRKYVNTDVVAVGMAVYRPSGALLRIDADALGAQTAADRFFATVPVPTGGKLDVRSLLREQGRRGGVSAMLGKVPAEESDEDFLAAVVEMD